MEDDDNFLADLGFKKDKFTSQAPFVSQEMGKTELIKTDSNLESEHGPDYTSNVSVIRDPPEEDVEENDMEVFLMNASNAELGFLKMSLTNIKQAELEERKRDNHKHKNEENDSEDEYKDDFEEIDEEIEVDEEDKDESGDESIEEDLDLEEDSSSGSDVERQMEKFRTQKERNDKVRQSTESEVKKRAISAKYQLSSQNKSSASKFQNIQADKSMKSNVIEALREENKRIEQEEIERRLKADTKKSRPFSSINASPKKISSKTRKPNVNPKIMDLNINYKVDETSSNTDLDRYESEDKASVYPKGSHPSTDAQMRKTDILKKIERLSDVQRQQLFFLLEQMEKGENLEKIDMKFLSPKPTMAKGHTIASKRLVSERAEKNEIRIRVLSTWGHMQLGGLTEIELFSNSGNKINLVPADIIIKNANKILCDQGRLINSKYLTTEEKDMWICSLPSYNKCLEIFVYYPKGTEVGALRFWNYNASNLESVKGIKEIEIILNGEIAWNGMIQRGEGNDNMDYSTVVKLDLTTVVPPVILKTKYIQKPELIIEEVEEQEVKQSLKVERKGFLARLEESKSDNISNKDSKSELGADDSSSSMPIWFQGKKAKEKSTTDTSSQKLPGIAEPRKKGGLSRRQAADLSKNDSSNIPSSNPFPEQAVLPRRHAAKSLSEEEKVKSHSLPSEKRRNRLGENTDGELIKGLDSLEYFEITNLGRIGANNKRQPLSKSVKPNRGPIKAKHYLDIDNETIFETEKINNQHIIAHMPSTVKDKKKIDIFEGQGDILDKLKADSQEPPQKHESDEEFEIKEELKIQNYEEKIKQFENIDFSIPNMPIGKTLEFTIISTWGDNHYVGLAGIEVFDNEGNKVKINSEDIMADPPDINILPGYTNDPRTVDKLVDSH